MSARAKEAGLVLPPAPKSGWDASHTCGTRWVGVALAHCSMCCFTFGSTSTFDSHRSGGECQHPEDTEMAHRDGSTTLKFKPVVRAGCNQYVWVANIEGGRWSES